MALPVADDPTYAIREKTLACISLFDGIEKRYDRQVLSWKIAPEAYSLDAELRDPFTFLHTRYDFDIWTYSNGVLSPPNPSSLDFEPEGSEDYAELLLDYLDIIWKALAFIYSPSAYPPVVTNSEFIKSFEHDTANLNIVVRRLHGVSDDIRQLWTGHVDQTRRATFSRFTVQDYSFRDYITCLVRHRFPAAGAQLHTLLGDSIAVRRRRLLDKCLHAKRVTAGRVPRGGISPENHGGEVPPNSQLDASLSAQKRAAHHPEGASSGSSEVVQLDAQDEGFKSIHCPKTEAFLRIISTIYLSNDEFFEYLPTPVIAEGRTQIHCPFCSDVLELGSDASKAWKHHIRQDLTPYPCLDPECADAFRSFVSRKKWKTHMKTRHDSNWVYKVSPNWYCRVGHEPQTFNTKLEWISHQEDIHDYKEHLSEDKLNFIVSHMNRVIPHSEFLCPLCKKFPEDTEHLLGKDNTSPQLIDKLLDHIANHLKSLSLKALPSVQHPPLDSQDMARLPIREKAACRAPSRTVGSSQQVQLDS